jgi:hypothetical protein
MKLMMITAVAACALASCADAEQSVLGFSAQARTEDETPNDLKNKNDFARRSLGVQVDTA